MKRILNILKNILPKDPPRPVGRWRNDQDNKQIIQKIDLSNEDHCGPCGQYALDRAEEHRVQNTVPRIKPEF